MTENNENRTKDEDENIAASEPEQNDVDVLDEVPDEETGEKAPKSADEELLILKDKYLRLAAEYDNYRKRSAKEREMTYSDARVDAITRLLPIYDNLERALKMDCSDEAYYKGIEMIMTGLTEVMESMGVKAIPAAGESFDPKYHNAVSSIVNPELGENTVAEEFQKGFTLGDRIIRFSTVVVANT